jgi:hypothetical protein
VSSADQIVAQLLREKQARDTGGCLKVVGTVWAVIMLAWFRPFMVMLALGLVHDRFAVVPALGFWETYVVLFATSVVFRFGDYAALMKTLRAGTKKEETGK